MGCGVEILKGLVETGAGTVTVIEFMTVTVTVTVTVAGMEV